MKKQEKINSCVKELDNKVILRLLKINKSINVKRLLIKLIQNNSVHYIHQSGIGKHTKYTSYYRELREILSIIFDINYNSKQFDSIIIEGNNSKSGKGVNPSFLDKYIEIIEKQAGEYANENCTCKDGNDENYDYEDYFCDYMYDTEVYLNIEFMFYNKGNEGNGDDKFSLICKIVDEYGESIDSIPFYHEINHTITNLTRKNRNKLINNAFEIIANKINN